jgi:endo-1,4-beta-D-glucanase Y
VSRLWGEIIQLGVVLCLILASLAACSSNPGLGDLERVLQDTWRSYARRHLAPDGRVVLSERGGESISEAQAYALMRALWAGDEAMFSRVYVWTRANLCRLETQGDHLLAWHWGKRADGSWGVLDWNTAADADLDYAMALWLAARRGWQPPKPWPAYDVEARRVAADILAKEVVQLPSGELLLAPGNWHEFEAPYLLNPSYSSPGAYNLFAKAGFDPRWETLRQSEYPILKMLGQGVGDMPGVGLFPDWVRLDVQGAFSPARGRDTNFGWEAVRLPWRIALDRRWFGEARTAGLLGQNFLPFFKKEWQSRGKLLAVYSYEGKPLVDYESPVLYAGVLGGALAAGDQEFARQMALKILSLYRVKDGESYFDSPDNYYANNWAWLGLALYAGWVRVY